MKSLQTGEGTLNVLRRYERLCVVFCELFIELRLRALFSLLGPPGCGLRRVWPELPESRPGVLLVSEKPHGTALSYRSKLVHILPYFTDAVMRSLCSGLIDSSAVTTRSLAWIFHPTIPVSWLWGWSMGLLPSMTCKIKTTRLVSSAAGKGCPLLDDNFSPPECWEV